jgi:hypothetical protein
MFNYNAKDDIFEKKKYFFSKELFAPKLINLLS